MGLEYNATQAEIKSKWRELSKEWHPDRFTNEDEKLDAQEKFMQLASAYETLSKIKNRRAKRNNAFEND